TVLTVDLLDGRGQLPRAVRSPRGPEVDDDGPATERRQRDRLAVGEPLERERGRRGAVQRHEVQPGDEIVERRAAGGRSGEQSQRERGQHGRYGTRGLSRGATA